MIDGQMIINLGKERKERLRKFSLVTKRTMTATIQLALDDLIPVQLDVSEVGGFTSADRLVKNKEGGLE